jgi:hypothetical protein
MCNGFKRGVGARSGCSFPANACQLRPHSRVDQPDGSRANAVSCLASARQAAAGQRMEAVIAGLAWVTPSAKHRLALACCDSRIVTPPVAKFGTSATTFCHAGEPVTEANCSGAVKPRTDRKFNHMRPSVAQVGSVKVAASRSPPPSLDSAKWTLCPALPATWRSRGGR